MIDATKYMLEYAGIERERLYLEWVSAAEGPRFAEEITKFTEKIRALGPLNWRDQWAVANSELRAASASE